jgi:predicted nucleic acid-binding protein
VIWVIDASIAIRWFLKEETHPSSDVVLQHMVDHPERFAVPELFCFEVFSVLCRVHPQGRKAFIKGMIPILHSGIFRQPMTASLAEKAAGFITKGLTGYDACYVALAQELNGVWLTFDRKAHQTVRHKGLSHDLSSGMPDHWS